MRWTAAAVARIAPLVGLSADEHARLREADTLEAHGVTADPADAVAHAAGRERRAAQDAWFQVAGPADLPVAGEARDRAYVDAARLAVVLGAPETRAMRAADERVADVADRLGTWARQTRRAASLALVAERGLLDDDAVAAQHTAQVAEDAAAILAAGPLAAQALAAEQRAAEALALVELTEHRLAAFRERAAASIAAQDAWQDAHPGLGLEVPRWLVDALLAEDRGQVRARAVRGRYQRLAGHAQDLRTALAAGQDALGPDVPGLVPPSVLAPVAAPAARRGVRVS